DQIAGESSSTGKVGVDADVINAETAISTAVSTSQNTELQEEFRRSKKDYLLRKIIEYQEIFSLLHTVSENDSYLFLDDLYHINQQYQADLIDYFHKVAKGNNLWIKIATIRNRTTWYRHSPQPIGIKIGDDAEEINLDLTLEKFSTTRDFLRSILRRY